MESCGPGCELILAMSMGTLQKLRMNSECDEGCLQLIWIRGSRTHDAFWGKRRLLTPPVRQLRRLPNLSWKSRVAGQRRIRGQELLEPFAGLL